MIAPAIIRSHLPQPQHGCQALHIAAIRLLHIHHRLLRRILGLRGDHGLGHLGIAFAFGLHRRLARLGLLFLIRIRFEGIIPQRIAHRFRQIRKQHLRHPLAVGKRHPVRVTFHDLAPLVGLPLSSFNCGWLSCTRTNRESQLKRDNQK